MNDQPQHLNSRETFFRVASGVLFLSGGFVAFGLGRVIASPPGFLGALIWMGFLARALSHQPQLGFRRVGWLISTLWHSGMLLISVMGVRAAGPSMVFFLVHSTLALGVSLAALWHDRPSARQW